LQTAVCLRELTPFLYFMLAAIGTTSSAKSATTSSAAQRPNIAMDPPLPNLVNSPTWSTGRTRVALPQKVHLRAAWQAVSPTGVLPHSAVRMVEGGTCTPAAESIL
jgi:hypothetical protein